MTRGELTIRTPDGTVAVPDSWLGLVASALAKPDGYVTVDDGAGDSYAQAFNLDGSLLLEYRDGSPHQHFLVEGVPLDAVVDGLRQWAAGERAFLADHAWTRLTDWDEN